MMNAGSCSGGGSYQHEVIVGDEDPSLSFASSPSWNAHSFEEIEIKDEEIAINYADDLGLSSGLQHEDENNDNSSCNSPEQTMEDPGIHECPDELKDNPFGTYQNVKVYKRKRCLEDVEETFKGINDYSRLLDGCKIIKKECNSGYLSGVSVGTEDELTESSQSDEEQHSLDEEDVDTVKREIRR